jgi:hypothetical protein
MLRHGGGGGDWKTDFLKTFERIQIVFLCSVLDREEILNSGGSPEQKIQDWKNETDFFQKGPFFFSFCCCFLFIFAFFENWSGFHFVRKASDIFFSVKFSDFRSDLVHFRLMPVTPVGPRGVTGLDWFKPAYWYFAFFSLGFKIWGGKQRKKVLVKVFWVESFGENFNKNFKKL